MSVVHRPLDRYEAVRKGAALLDETTPGWFLRVSLNELNMESCTRCVLGQLYGNYVRGLRALFGNETADGALIVPPEKALDYGFVVEVLGVDEYERAVLLEDDYRTLLDAWSKEIADRLVP